MIGSNGNLISITMTTQLKKALDRVQELPEEQQNWVADLVLRALDTSQGLIQSPFWATKSPNEHAQAFRKWSQSFKGGANLPDEALRRVNMYD